MPGPRALGNDEVEAGRDGRSAPTIRHIWERKGREACASRRSSPVSRDGERAASRRGELIDGATSSRRPEQQARGRADRRTYEVAEANAGRGAPAQSVADAAQPRGRDRSLGAEGGRHTVVGLRSVKVRAGHHGRNMLSRNRPAIGEITSPEEPRGAEELSPSTRHRAYARRGEGKGFAGWRARSRRGDP